MKDPKVWLSAIALLIAIASPFIVFYANNKVMDNRLSTIEGNTNAVEWGEFKNKVITLENQVGNGIPLADWGQMRSDVESLKRQVTRQWELFRELQDR